MLTVSCRDVGMDCDYVCKGETEEEIMKNAEQHAVQDHHYKAEDIMTPELQQKIKSHIKRELKPLFFLLIHPGLYASVLLLSIIVVSSNLLSQTSYPR
jgi:predicted small metal-binding protein